MHILAIDPGPVESAYVRWNGNVLLESGKVPNDRMRELVRAHYDHALVVEWVASFGMPVGAEVFHTCRWVGIFEANYRGPDPVVLIERLKVKMHLCHSARARDSNIRQALIDRFGAPGTKKSPGLTHGLKNDTWQAFALAVYAADTQRRESLNTVDT